MTIKRRKFQLGILTKPTTTAATLEGELYANSSSLTFKVYIDGAERDLLTADQAQTITNKSVDADNNTITNLETDNLKAGVLVTTISAATSDTELPSALAVKTALAGQNEASEITYDNATSGLTATDVQAAVDETEGRLDTAETNIGNNATAVSDHLADAIDAHDASAISNVPAGNLAATEVQAALNELQTDVDSRALDSALTAHTGDAVDAHDASAISNVPSGNLAATDVQAALNELQTELDSVATSTDLSNHESDTSTHGVTTVAGLDETQTFTNKTLTSPDINTPDIDGGTASNSSRIKLPTDTTTNLDALTDVESLFAYDSTKKKPVFNDGSGWNEVGSGAGGGINYILNPDAEVDTTGWATYDNGAVAIPTDGTTGSATSNYNRNTTSPLRGSGDFVFQKSTANVQGEGFSYDFIVDNADQAKKLLVSFDYDASDALYVDDDMGVFIYDVTNANLIRVNGENLKAGKGTHYAQFQTASDSVSYRLIVHQVSTNAGDIDIYFDNFQVGPQKLAYGAIITDWETYTPQVLDGATDRSSEFTTIDFRHRRVGDSIEIEGFLSRNGSATAGAGGNSRITVPSGITLDSSYRSETANRFVTSITPTNGPNIQVSSNTMELTGTIAASQYAYNGTNFPANAKLAIKFSYPVTGWSSNSKMSEDFGGRDVSLQASGNDGLAITANSEDIPFKNIDHDSTGSWTNAGNNNGTVAGVGIADAFTTPETGEYIIMGNIRADVASSAEVCSYIDGVSGKLIGWFDGSIYCHFKETIQLTKGQVLTLRADIGFTLNSSSNSNWITITKLASQQQVLETETVVARYASNAGAAVSAGNNIIFENLGYDSHNAYNSSTGVYTAPTTGKFKGSVKIKPSVSSTVEIGIEVNGTEVDVVEAGTTTNSVVVPFQVELAKGDTLEITNSAGVSLTLNTTSANNVLELERIK